MSKKIKVRLEDADIIVYEGHDDTAQKLQTKIGIHANDFHDYELLFEHEVDQRCYYWFTESEFKEVIDTLDNTSNLYPLDDGAFIYEMSDNNEPFEITLDEEVTS